MISFKHFIIEQSKTLKSYITDILINSGIKLTSSSRHGYHIRFPLQGNLKEFNSFFSSYGLVVKESPESYSGQFPTYNIQVKNSSVSGFNVGENIVWVNNYVGKDSAAKRIFNTKDLTPSKLNITGRKLTIQQLISACIDSITNLAYSDEIKQYLVNLLSAANTSSKEISINFSLPQFSTSDYATISKDFGEVLCAIWALKNTQYTAVIFPESEAEKLVDFYLTNSKKNLIPISVKSGSGSKVTIVNILDAIDASNQNVNIKNEPAYKIFEIVKNYPMKDAMVELHKEVNSPALIKLAEIIGIPSKNITLSTIKDYLESKTVDDLKSELVPFLSILNTKLSDKVWNSPDKLRLIISPLGESIWKILNNSKSIKNSLSKLANLVDATQMNITITKNNIAFDSNEFSNAEFEFGWAGYSAGNKLGFKMTLK